ncbi:MAG: BNR-4 repeat-containing protein [Spirochaetales bacterium]|nr:BNR-4 repeat-containing protein [Spirochaetales bacterium]
MNKRILVLLIPFLAACAGFKYTPGTNSYEEFVLGSDGAWCWFSDTRAIVAGDYLYTGWVKSCGSIEVVERNLKSGESKIENLSPSLEIDDHNNPSFVKLKGGKILVFYSKHSTDEGIMMRSKIVGADSWGDEMSLKLNNLEGYKASGYFGDYEGAIHNLYTYSNPMYLEDVGENGRLFLFWRGLDYKPNYAWSDDRGETWSKGFIAVSSKISNRNQRPYVKYFSNGKDTIHIAFTDGHPRNEAENKVYYMKFQDGAFRNSDGDILSELGGMPVDPLSADLVYDASLGRSWIWDIKADLDGKPRIVYTVMPSEVEHNYYFASLNDGKWNSSYVAYGGRWFPSTPLFAKEPEPHYSPGIVLDSVDTDRVYFSSFTETGYELFTAVKRESTWDSSSITENSAHNNVRPYSFSYGGESYLLWMQNLKYVHYTNFKSRILLKKMEF